MIWNEWMNKYIYIYIYMHRALGNLRQVHTNQEEERDDAKCMKMKAAIGFRSLDIDGWITSMFSLVVSGRRRCIFLGSCMAAWVHLQVVYSICHWGLRGRWRAWTWTGPAVQARACMHRMVPMGLGGSRGHMHACTAGRRGSRARADSVSFDLKPMGDYGKIKLKPAMQGRRVHALHIHGWIYGRKQIAQNARWKFETLARNVRSTTWYSLRTWNHAIMRFVPDKIIHVWSNF